MTATRRAVVAGVLAMASSDVLAGAAPPRRVVSLSPCLDTMLVNLVDEHRIAALSRWSRQEGGSTITALARRLPFTYGSAEEIALLRPDLVISSIPTPIALRQSLPRLNIPLVLFKVPDTVDQSIAQVREVAAYLGAEDRGEALTARIRAALARAAPPPGARPVSALIFQRDGFASGPGTLMDEMLTRTGFSNQIRRYGMTASGNVPLERLIEDPPQVLLTGEHRPGTVSWGEKILAHPALARMGGRMRSTPFAASLMYCGGPVLIRTAETLRAARLSYLGQRT